MIIQIYLHFINAKMIELYHVLMVRYICFCSIETGPINLTFHLNSDDVKYFGC